MVSLFGYGKTTSELSKRIKGCNIFDDKFSKTEEFNGNFLRPMSEFDPDKSTLEIVSPGIEPNHIVVKKQNI